MVQVLSFILLKIQGSNPENAKESQGEKLGFFVQQTETETTTETTTDNTNIEVIFKFCLYEYYIDIINSDIFVATIGQGSFSVILDSSHKEHKISELMNEQIINILKVVKQ